MCAAQEADAIFLSCLVDILHPLSALCRHANDEKVDTLTDGEWKTCTKATAKGFSCVGYRLAKDLSKEMPGVAIGVIDTSYSGSDIGE